MVLTLFGRNVEIQVAHKIFSLTSFDIEFNIDNAVGKSGTDVQPSARADISIWNLSDDSIALFKVGATVQVRAGYADDLDTILLGSIKAATPERDGADVKLQILSTDNLANLFTASSEGSLTFPKGTSFTSIVAQLLTLSKIQIGKIMDPGVTPVSDLTLTGPKYSDMMTQVLQEVNGLRDMKASVGADSTNNPMKGHWQLYTVNGLAYFVSPSYQDVTVAVLSAATGLLEITRNQNDKLISTTPDDGSTGDAPTDITQDDGSSYDYTPAITYSMTCLLQNKIQMGAIVQINSSTYTGLGKVLKYTHTCSASDFTSKIEVVPLTS
jgi:hypothetical protein